MNQILRSFSIQRVDFYLLIPVFTLVGISLLTLYSVDFSLFKQQLISFILGVAAYILFLNVDYKIFNFFAKQIYIGILILLGIVLLIGFESKGAVRWIDVFGVSIQFSEIIKPFFIIAIAYFLSRNELHSLNKFLLTFILIIPVFFLILRQPDLGNAIIYFFSAVFMMFVYGFPIRYFLGMGIIVAIPMPLFFNLLKEYQRERIFSFLNTTADPFGSSYNSIQSLISIGSGGFWGKGFGQATQSTLRFLPERHTDFIFATITESLGFIGGIVIITLFILILLRIYRIAINSADTFSYVVAMGMFFVILVHVFFNIGMNLGLLPIVGITLPLVSYGGSSLITNFIILSILSSIRSDEKKAGIFEIS
jgi:rod shape determining protein RodA